MSDDGEIETVVAASSRKGGKKNKGGRPKGARTTRVNPEVALRSPEVQALISEAVAMATAKLTADLAAARGRHGTEPQSGDAGMARQLALAIAEISDQGSNRKRVAPEVLEARRIAHEKMNAMILDYAAQGVAPEYELTRAVYLAEELVEPTYIDRDHVTRRTRIEWPGVPNEGMSPYNEAARQIFGAFMESIGGATKNVTRESPMLSGKQETGSQSGLKVMHKPEVRQGSPVGKPRNSGVTKVGRRQAGDVVETAVLGTVAEPARQIA
jgi:hypothetical protein